MDKKVKCIKCQNDVSEQDCIKTEKGYVCNSCARKKKSLYYVFGGIVVVLLCVVAYVWLRPEHTKGFSGVGNIQDSTIVQTDSAMVEFCLDKVVAKSSPVVANKTVENIEAFKIAFAENIKTAKAKKANGVVIPTIRVLFTFQSAEFSDDSKGLLQEFAKAYLQTNKQASVLISGYTCNLGTNDVNNWWSKERAENTKALLTSFGIPSDRISVQWFGKSKNSEFSYRDIKEYRRAIISIK